MSIPVDRISADRVGPPIFQPKPQATQPSKPVRISFSDHLENACKEVGCKVQFSGHAESRVHSRSIQFDESQLIRLGKAVQSASDKGAKKALVMLDDMALIVGVDKRTVITVVDNQGIRDNVFTSIDSAVIA